MGNMARHGSTEVNSADEVDAVHQNLLHTEASTQKKQQDTTELGEHHQSIGKIPTRGKPSASPHLTLSTSEQNVAGSSHQHPFRHHTFGQIMLEIPYHLQHEIYIRSTTSLQVIMCILIFRYLRKVQNLLRRTCQ